MSMNLSYIGTSEGNYQIQNDDTLEVYGVSISGGVVANSAQAVEYVRNYGISRRPIIASGTHTKITYDLYGIVTSGTNATTADINDSVDRRYVTDAQLAAIGGLQQPATVHAVAQAWIEATINSGVQSPATIAVEQPQEDMAYSITIWMKAAANQHNKTIRGYLNTDVNDLVFEFTESYDDEIIVITIDGIVQTVAANNQSWITSLDVSTNKNHSNIDYRTTTQGSITQIKIETDTTHNDDLYMIGYRSLYSLP